MPKAKTILRLNIWFYNYNHFPCSFSWFESASIEVSFIFLSCLELRNIERWDINTNVGINYFNSINNPLD